MNDQSYKVRQSHSALTHEMCFVLCLVQALQHANNRSTPLLVATAPHAQCCRIRAARIPLASCNVVIRPVDTTLLRYMVVAASGRGGTGLSRRDTRDCTHQVVAVTAGVGPAVTNTACCCAAALVLRQRTR